MLSSVLNVIAQNYYMASPEGFGKNTTGGGNVSPVTVTTYTDLKNKIKLATPQVILISGTIEFAPTELQISEIVTNKTIIGLQGARLINNKQTQSESGILNLKPGSSNVIIRNLIFEGPGAYDVDGRDNLTSEGCVNLWVDHCEFQDGMDGNFDNKGLTDNVTISWSKFTYLKAPNPNGFGGTADHRFTNLVGSSSSDKPADGHFSITFQNCYWADGCKERMPRARNAELHILNCYYSTSVAGSLAIGLGGGTDNNNTTCYVENTNFDNIGTVFKSYISTDGGTVDITFDGCISTKSFSNFGNLVSKPSYSYSVIPVDDVSTYITNATCGAGANLQVNASTGALSSSCDSLGVDEDLVNLGVKYYPTIIEDSFNIDFSNNISGNAVVKIYSITGQNVLKYSKDITFDKKINLNLSNLYNGLYICQLNIANGLKSFKLMKK
jgi:pectate lyase